MCATEYGVISDTHTQTNTHRHAHTHREQYDLFKFINTRVGGKKAALWNQTLPFLLCQLTEPWAMQTYSTKHTHTYTHTKLLPGHIVHRHNKSFFSIGLDTNNPVVREAVRWLCFKLGFKVHSIICCDLEKTRVPDFFFFFKLVYCAAVALNWNQKTAA